MAKRKQQEGLKRGTRRGSEVTEPVECHQNILASAARRTQIFWKDQSCTVPFHEPDRE